MDEYVVGAVADIIAGNLTPNRPATHVKKAKTPVKHQPSPHVTPRSETVPSRDILLSPTLLRKKAVAKKSPKRIFEREDLDKTAEVINSPKANKVKKHLQEDLDSSKNLSKSSKEEINSVVINRTVEESNTPKKNKKRKKSTVDTTGECGAVEHQVDTLERSEMKLDEQHKKNKKRSKSTVDTPTEDDDVENQDHTSDTNKIQSDERKKKNKKRKKSTGNITKEDSDIENKDDEIDINEIKSNKRIKNKTKKSKVDKAVIENNDNVISFNENKSAVENAGKKKNKKVENIDTDSEHESDNEIESETEQEVKKILDSGPIEGENSSDEDEAPKPKKSKMDKESSGKQEIANTDEEARRTLFVGNVPLSKKTKKQIKQIFNKYGTIETVRIRAVPVKDMRTKPKVAAIKNEIHPDRTSVNVYIKFADESSVTKALVENNREMGSHHLRVTRSDGAGGHDARRALFVGNLPLGVEDEAVRAVFQRCGEIDSVRVVRDRVTQIGKGFGYVNFKSSDGVELALNLSEEDLTIKNRILRVKRYTQAPPGQKVISKPNQGQGKTFGRNQGNVGKFNGQRGGGANSNSQRNGGANFNNHKGSGANQTSSGKEDGAFRRIQNKRKLQDNASDKSKQSDNTDNAVKQKKPKKEFVGMTAEKKKKQKKKFDKQSKKKKALSEILTKGSKV